MGESRGSREAAVTATAPRARQRRADDVAVRALLQSAPANAEAREARRTATTRPDAAGATAKEDTAADMIGRDVSECRCRCRGTECGHGALEAGFPPRKCSFAPSQQNLQDLLDWRAENDEPRRQCSLRTTERCRTVGPHSPRAPEHARDGFGEVRRPRAHRAWRAASRSMRGPREGARFSRNRAGRRRPPLRV